ncbi:unnamed protein product, partial [Chrysoparadoxa australica]
MFRLSFSNISLVDRSKKGQEGAMGQQQLEDGEEEEDEKGDPDQELVSLYVYLTFKKPKRRMADLEETAFLLKLDVGLGGCICK